MQRKISTEQAYLLDVESMTDNLIGDLDEAEAIETINKLIEKLSGVSEKLQEKICEKAECFIDSFGGSDCTMRELKGE